MKTAVARLHYLVMPSLLLLCACSGNAELTQRELVEQPRLSDYQFGFRLTTQEVIAYQGLWVRELLKNVTDKSLPQPNFMLGGNIFGIRLTDSVGAEVYVPIPQGSGFAFTSRASIPAGDSMVLYHYFANSLWDPTCGESCILAPGDYQIIIGINRRVFFEYEDSPDSIITLPFSICVASSAEAETQVQYREAYDRFVKRDYAGRVNLCRELIEEHPTSPLLETLYRHILFIEDNVPSTVKAKEDWVTEGLEMVESIPESPLCRDVVRGLKSRLDPAVFDSLLTRVRAKSPDSPILEIEFDKP